MAAEDHLAALLARGLDHPPQVADLHAHPPLAREADLRVRDSRKWFVMHESVSQPR